MSSIKRPLPTGLTLVLTAALGALLTGCASTPAPKPAPAETATAKPLLPFDQYHPVVKAGEDRLSLTPHPSGALSDAQRLALGDLVQRRADQAGANVILAIASGEAQGSTADLTRRSAAAYLVSLGVNPEHLRLAEYAPSAGANPVVVSYTASQAMGPDCSKGWGDYGATGANAVNSHFGCADAANLAALVADPRDLVRPSPEQPADAGRRATVLGKYRKGDVTSSAKDDQATGSISQSVK